MHKSLFLAIANFVEKHDCFKLRRGALGEISVSPLIKCTADV
jgi:hypothetical protein